MSNTANVVQIRSAVLNAEAVVEIRQAYAEGRETQAALAARYGVSQATIGNVVSGTSWRDAGGPIHIPRPEMDRLKDEMATLPDKARAKAVAEDARTRLVEADGVVIALEVLEKLPPRYAELATALVNRAMADPGVRAKVIAAVGAALMWDEAWDDDCENKFLPAGGGDYGSESCALLSRVGEAVSGPVEWRDWLKPWPPREGK